MTQHTLHLGDCLEVMRTMPDCSVHAVVCDPPYGLADHPPKEVAACLAAWLAGDTYQPSGKGFMGKAWDAWVPGPEVWRECLRVLKPGGHLLAFAGTRSMDLMSMAVRLAGFELRDSIGWAHDGGGAPLLAYVYGSGFPKSLSIDKAIDKAAGAEREVVGKKGGRYATPKQDFRGGKHHAAAGTETAIFDDITAPATPEAQQWAGFGTALKPAWEPVILARRPLEGTVAANVLEHGTGGINVDGCRIGAEPSPSVERRKGRPLQREAGTWANDRRSPETYATQRPGEQLGRWPANLIHDGSDDVVGLFPQTTSTAGMKGTRDGAIYGGGKGLGGENTLRGHSDTGSAARFFYTAKATKAERQGVTHPTVKPLDLMAYLCRLVTPPGGTVLDPFMGSGTTIKAAIGEGFNAIGIERDPAYFAMAEHRMNGAQLGLNLEAA